MLKKVLPKLFLKKKNIPFRSFKIIKRNEEALGSYFFFYT